MLKKRIGFFWVIWLLAVFVTIVGCLVGIGGHLPFKPKPQIDVDAVNETAQADSKSLHAHVKQLLMQKQKDKALEFILTKLRTPVLDAISFGRIIQAIAATDIFNSVLANMDTVISERKKADQGYFWLELGYVCSQEKDFTKAENFYQKAISISKDSSNKLLLAQASYALGQIYEQRNDLKKAEKYYYISAIKDPDESSYREILFKLLKKTKQYNSRTALDLLCKQAEEDNFFCQLKLARCYQNGVDVKKNFKKAFKLYSQAAKVSERESKNDLGFCYLEGIGVKKNYSEAVKWFKIAARQKSPKAEYNLAYCLKTGKGIGKNAKEADRILNNITRTEAEDTLHLALCFYNGFGVKKDYSKAVEYFKKSILYDNNINAKYYYAYCLFNGLGTSKNQKQALALMADNAKLDEVKSCLFLGKCYYYGLGVDKDYAKAIKYFSTAADEKNMEISQLEASPNTYIDNEVSFVADAQMLLGIYYYEKRNLPLAGKFLDKALLNGRQDALKWVDKLKQP